MTRRSLREKELARVQETRGDDNNSTKSIFADNNGHNSQDESNNMRDYPNNADCEFSSDNDGLYYYCDRSILHASNGREYEYNCPTTFDLRKYNAENVAGKVLSKTLKSIPGNNKCFDCTIEDPEWVNITYAVFLCEICARVHAEFGLITKPFSDDCLTERDCALLANAGNKIASDYWMAVWTPESGEYLYCGASLYSRKQYIIEKYKGKWVSSDEQEQLQAACLLALQQGDYHAQQSTRNNDSSMDRRATKKAQGASFDPKAQHNLPVYVLNNMTFHSTRKGKRAK